MSKTISNRNPFAVIARSKSGSGYHKHRNQPRGGARNLQQDYLEAQAAEREALEGESQWEADIAIMESLRRR
jgi:hypothetical protein